MSAGAGPEAGEAATGEASPGSPPVAGDDDATEGYPVDTGERFFVLINPRAVDDATAFRRRVAAEFAGHAVPFDLYVAPDPESGLAAARAAARAGCRAVAAAGGDGTVAQALRATAGTDVPVAILPFGTGNQLAVNFDIPGSLEGSVRVAVEGEPEAIDLGTANGEHFALIAGAGLDAEVMADATEDLKSRFGFGAYLLSGLRHVVAPRSADFRIVADDEELEVRATMVLLANVGLLGTGPFPMELQVGPEVSWRDGRVDICVFAPRTLPDTARMVWQMARQEYVGNERMIFLQAQEVRVEAEPVVPVQIDGEPAGETPLEVEMLPLAARVMMPA